MRNEKEVNKNFNNEVIDKNSIRSIRSFIRKSTELYEKLRTK